ncbi:MAG: glycerol-3-phosphate responsive antiterminator [Firmicutes bacterium]|nr:glycerol-3-phosphate responsive antiterminator [Bacillota bacterium]
MIEMLREAPIIAAVRGREHLSRALASKARVVFLLGADLFTLPEMVREALYADKRVFVHLDLVEGISRDAAGVRLLKAMARPTGVLSTRAPLLRAAAQEGLQTVLRVFLVDSSSLESGVRMVKTCAPDWVEAMPGMVTRAIGQLKSRAALPIIAGGMLEKPEDVEAVLRAGARAASTSHEALWNWQG